MDHALTALRDKLLKERFAVSPVAASPEATEPDKTQAAPTPADEPEVPAATTKEAGGEGQEPPAMGESRYIPAAVRRQVVQRDGLRCTFVDSHGRRCEDARFLELHHRLPWARGGPNTADNLTLRCRCHNGLAAMLDFGPRVPVAGRGPLPRVSNKGAPTG